MKTASIRDLHIRTSELVRETAEVTVITIERYGKAVAELRPLTQEPSKPQLPYLTELWQRFPSVPGDSGRYLEEER